MAKNKKEKKGGKRMKKKEMSELIINYFRAIIPGTETNNSSFKNAMYRYCEGYDRRQLPD